MVTTSTGFKLRAVLSALLALVAGLAQAWALADPWARTPHGWLQIVSLALLAGLLLQPAITWRRGFALAWVFSLAWLAGTFWWLFISMHRYGGMNAAVAALAVLALAGALALYYGVAGAVFAALAGSRCGASCCAPLRHATLFAALWTLAELARGQWFTGFPWGAGGYAHVDGLLAGYAPWIGVYGIGLAAAWSAAALASVAVAGVTRRSRPGGSGRESGRFALAATVLALCLLYGLPYGLQMGAQRLAPSSRDDALPPMTVALLQGNIPQDEKFVPGAGVALSLRWYGKQFERSAAPLTIAPETAIPLLPDQLPPGYWAALAARFGQGDQALLTGIPLGNLETGYTNAVIGLAPGAAQPYRYDKHHLVPFGEFIPPLFRWFVRLMDIPLGDFNRGLLAQPSFTWHGERLAPTICYEDLFGEELAARFADPARAPTALVNVSNLAWFGDTLALDQHLAISRMRALELARPVLRATNTGATAIIDAQGRVTQALPYATRGVLVGQFSGQTHITPYAWWASRWGLLPLWAACLIIGAMAGWAVRQP
ncbi:MAG: apolipoprotein N-acyltransferase [Burkholderiaceae bacterium]|nr:apolipoprotein N-acyltransferase [Burkholderiaceae bacterium]